MLITPLIYSDVDITPYYTDYYEMRDTGVANTNLYNITTNGDYYYASSPLPKKSGYIYSEEYLKKYVYDTCLEVPERTRDAITMKPPNPNPLGHQGIPFLFLRSVNGIHPASWLPTL